MESEPITDAEAKEIASNLPIKLTKHWETLLERLLADRAVANRITERFLLYWKVQDPTGGSNYGNYYCVHCHCDVKHDEEHPPNACVVINARALIEAVKGEE